MMTDHSVLIARLEAGETGREIDAEIAAALRILPDNAPSFLENWTGPFEAFRWSDGEYAGLWGVAAMHSDGRRSVNWFPPKLTTSLDAALDHMVPEGWLMDGLYWVANIVHAHMSNYPVALQESGRAPTAAAAVCAAGLRAREER